MGYLILATPSITFLVTFKKAEPVIIFVLVNIILVRIRAGAAINV